MGDKEIERRDGENLYVKGIALTLGRRGKDQ